MAEIVGTITNLSDFLSKTQVCLSVKPNDPQQQIICLEADRKYSIPAFQREVRWDDNNLKMLLYDLSRSSKFLGNIILTIKSDHTCEIIDGCENALGNHRPCVISNHVGYLQPYHRYYAKAGGGAYRPQNRRHRRPNADDSAGGKERYLPGRIHAVQAQNTQAWDGLCHDD